MEYIKGFKVHQWMRFVHSEFEFEPSNPLLMPQIPFGIFGAAKYAAAPPTLLKAGFGYSGKLERLTVNTFADGRVHLMRTYRYAVEGTKILVAAVVFTLLDRTFNAFICFAVHFILPPKTKIFMHLYVLKNYFKSIKVQIYFILIGE